MCYGGGKKGGKKKEDDFVNFGMKEAYCNFVNNLYNFFNQIDLDPLLKNKLTEIEFGK